MIEVTPAEHAAAIVAARADLYFFSRWMFMQRKGFKWLRGVHHARICEALYRVYTGECTRLIINVPPRYSKTELAVVNFMAWCLGQCPDAEFIHTSYSSRLASNNSWQARELVSHPAYAQIFPKIVLRQDSHAKDEWRTEAGGCVYAVGAGGTITGYGAGKQRPGFGGAIIIDDPHKADEAHSDLVRQGVIDWFQNTLESRKNSPQTPIIVIMQRLHERDLAGWLLAGGNGEKWEHLRLPAMQTDGTALWPAKHTVEQLLVMETAAPYVYAGQYGQRPAPPAGGTIKPDKLQVIDALPADLEFIRGWDLGGSVNGDPTAGVKIGRSRSTGRFVIADVVKTQSAPEEVEATLKNTAARDGKSVRISIPQDPGQAGKAQVTSLTKLLAGNDVRSSPESGDKVTRALPFAAQVNVGNVDMLRAEWNDAYVNELRHFPNGAHDDQVDASSRAFNEFSANPANGLDYLRALAAQQAANQAKDTK